MVPTDYPPVRPVLHGEHSVRIPSERICGQDLAQRPLEGRVANDLEKIIKGTPTQLLEGLAVGEFHQKDESVSLSGFFETIRRIDDGLCDGVREAADVTAVGQADRGSVRPGRLHDPSAPERLDRTFILKLHYQLLAFTVLDD